MAQATEINPAVHGMVGKKVVVAEDTLGSGEATITTPLSKVEYVLITEKAASSSGLKYSYSVTTSVITVYDSAGGTGTVSVLAIGY